MISAAAVTIRFFRSMKARSELIETNKAVQLPLYWVTGYARASRRPQPTAFEQA